MKIFLLVLFLLSMTLYASGCIVLVQSGYKLSDYADELNIDPNTFKFNFGANGFNLNFNDSSVSKDYTINDNINEININLNSQDIKVINYDGQDLKVQVKSHNSMSGELLETENENKLVLNTKYDTPDNASILVSIPASFNHRGTLKIITSSGDMNVSKISIDTLNLSTASGDIDVSNLNLSYLSLTNSSGDIKFNTISALTETKLSSSSGDIVGSGSLGTVNGSTASGDINLQFKDSLSNTSLSSASGSISLSLPKDIGYKINYKTVSGSLDSSNRELSFGDESSLINVDTVSGDLNIN